MRTEYISQLPDYVQGLRRNTDRGSLPGTRPRVSFSSPTEVAFLHERTVALPRHEIPEPLLFARPATLPM